MHDEKPSVRPREIFIVRPRSDAAMLEAGNSPRSPRPGGQHGSTASGVGARHIRRQPDRRIDRVAELAFGCGSRWTRRIPRTSRREEGTLNKKSKERRRASSAHARKDGVGVSPEMILRAKVFGCPSSPGAARTTQRARERV